MANPIGFIGLGRMGQAMARNLMRAGFALRVYNRTPERAEELVREGAERVSRPADVAEPDGIVVTMVSDDYALDEVTLGELGLESRLGEGGIHLAMSTIAPGTARRLAEYHRMQGATLVSAPVFGRPDAAAAAKLWICVSGDAKAKQRVRLLLDAMGQGVFDFGDHPGAANVVKLAGNFLIVAAMESMAEAFTLAEKHGVSREAVAAMIGQTLFACPIYQNYGKAIAAQVYEPVGFKLALGLKDVNLVLQSAADVSVPMPVASHLHDRLVSSVAKGRQDMDWTALAIEVSEEAGLD